MEYSLQGYYDIGVSYGLGDDVFEKVGDATVPDILAIGIRNPLGLGRLHEIDPNSDVVRQWREKAADKLEDKEMELGYDDALSNSFEEFKHDLRRLIQSHPINLCHLTIYAIGVVFIRIDFAKGIPAHFLEGFGHCFEYAAYLPPISMALLNTARGAAQTALRRPTQQGRWRWWRSRSVGANIQSLSKRLDPEIQKDRRGYEESRLFSGFTHVAMCIDEQDDVDDIKRRLLPTKADSDAPDSKPIHFELHGTLHFNWGACVLEPRAFDNPNEDPRQQIQRMLLCIQIAHSFSAACEAFEKLFFQEVMRQADGYIKGVPVPDAKNHVELNRLRTLALAIVTLTRFAIVAVAEEDQAFFAAYDEQAKLASLHNIILQRADILLNVETSEADEKKTNRELFLNTVALFLTGFTLVSVLTDMYTFATDEGELLRGEIIRSEILAAILALIFMVLLYLRGRIMR